MNEAIYLQTAQALARIKTHLQHLELWTETAPSDEALADPSPFCYESMPFEHWLQFVFLPKMSDLVANQQALPTQFAISPMAQMRFDNQTAAQALIDELIALEKLLDEPR
ncbi:YqcC family protein [Shewanella sp. Scap07]|uniref:YqcC family protein n=1 Tax=Shewanella sp. Scap07 TaxID=2589987 RepID=UPI0015B79436|nr:YqcC family protein [Shewanella sp. Scap07]QLE84861.1 YqcC family protein [Shewanella sp. Scap07]